MVESRRQTTSKTTELKNWRAGRPAATGRAKKSVSNRGVLIWLPTRFSKFREKGRKGLNSMRFLAFPPGSVAAAVRPRAPLLHAGRWLPLLFCFVHLSNHGPAYLERSPQERTSQAPLFFVARVAVPAFFPAQNADISPCCFMCSSVRFPSTARQGRPLSLLVHGDCFQIDPRCVACRQFCVWDDFVFSSRRECRIVLCFSIS